jgi:hypothetical protein
MRLERHRGSEGKAITMGRFKVLKEDPIMRIDLSRSGVLVLWAGCMASIVVPGGFGVWTVASMEHHSNKLTIIIYCLLVISMMVMFLKLDYGFSPLIFDRRTKGVERRGRSVGHWGNILSIRVVNRPLESGDNFYAVLLVMTGESPDGLDLIELGSFHERIDVIAYATTIADFLGVQAAEGGEPRPRAKPLQPARQCDLE